MAYRPLRPIAGLLAFLLLGSRDVGACSCNESTLEQQVQAADYVFMAWVTSATIPDAGPDQGWMTVRYKDPIVYKGSEQPFDSIRTPSDSAACGSSVRVPSIYWFFTDARGVFYSCEGSQPTTTPNGQELSSRVLDKVIELKRRQVRSKPAADGG